MNKKQRDRLLLASWEKVVAANARPLEKGAKAKAAKASSVRPTKIPQLVVPTERSSRTVASFDSGKGSTALPVTVPYTGTKVLGVVVLHKSCLQPVFSQEAVVDAAKMRR